MRTQFIDFERAETIEKAHEIAPWACGIVEMEEGFKAYECSNEFWNYLDESFDESDYMNYQTY